MDLYLEEGGRNLAPDIWSENMGHFIVYSATEKLDYVFVVFIRFVSWAFDVDFQVVIVALEKFGGNVNESLEYHDDLFNKLHDLLDGDRKAEERKEL